MIDKICKCRCHTKDMKVMHFRACCNYTYEKYLNTDGSFDQDAYDKIVEKHKDR